MEGEVLIISHEGEALYRPGEVWVCDEEKKRLMACMHLGNTLEDWRTSQKARFTLRKVPGTIDKYHILSWKGEPLYRPGEMWVCDQEKKRLKAFLYLGTTLEDWTSEKAMWTVQKVPGTHDKYRILSWRGEPLYRPGVKPGVRWAGDAKEKKRLPLLMYLGTTLEDWKSSVKAMWTLRVPGADVGVRSLIDEAHRVANQLRPIQAKYFAGEQYHVLALQQTSGVYKVLGLIQRAFEINKGATMELLYKEASSEHPTRWSRIKRRNSPHVTVTPRPSRSGPDAMVSFSKYNDAHLSPIWLYGSWLTLHVAAGGLLQKGYEKKNNWDFHVSLGFLK